VKWIEFVESAGYLHREYSEQQDGRAGPLMVVWGWIEGFVGWIDGCV
jgi:hypothetical protein